MQLNIEQNKLIQAKPSGHSLIRGAAGSGKTTVAVNRIPFLLYNYCLESNDRILMVTYTKTLVKYIKYIYTKHKEENQLQYGNLFSIDDSKVDIYNLDKIIFEYYRKNNKGNYKPINSNSSKYSALNKAIAELKKKYTDVNVLDISNSKFLLDEIEWIKACNYMEIEEYQNADRIGRASKGGNDGPQKLLKNSKTREAIYNLMLLYSEKIKKDGYIDFEDMALLALEQVKKSQIKKYTHIIVDESQDLTRVQLEFLKCLQLKKEYSSFMFVADTAQSIYPQAWLVKGRSFTSLDFDMKGKSNILSKSYRTTTQISKAAYSLIENDINIVEDDNFVKPSLIDKQGDYPVYKAFKDEIQQGECILNKINKLLKTYNLRDIAISAKNKNQLKWMEDYLNKNKLNCTLIGGSNDDFDSNNIKLLTMHSIKGLEFKVVFLIGLNEGVIPYISYSEDEDQSFQESIERKLLYVGMTRSTDKLYLFSSGKPSRFINDIYSKYLRLEDSSRFSKFYNVPHEDYVFADKISDLYSNEEMVRQWFIKELEESYGYPKELIDIEYQVNSFSKLGFVDVCVSIYSNNTKVPYIFVEIKRQGTLDSAALSQLKSYMSNCSKCQYGVVSNGNECTIINKDFEEVDDIPEFNASMLPQSVESKKYVDLKYGKECIIMSDSDFSEEITINENNIDTPYSENELRYIDIYSDIAAGLPIHMNSKSDKKILLPKVWFNDLDEYFALRVKGDSMIDAHINNGDMVVLKKQNTAENRQIVAAAVDSDNATLKRFLKMGSTVLLVPENEKYEAIQIKSDEAKIMGVVVGVMKG